MREQEYKEICMQIKKTEECLNCFQKILDSSKIEREFGNPYPNGEPSYNKKKKIDWEIVKRRRVYNYSWRKIAGEVGVSHTALIKRAKKLNLF